MKSKQGQFFSLQNQSETFFQKQILALCCMDLIAYRDYPHESNYRPPLTRDTLKIAIVVKSIRKI